MEQDQFKVSFSLRAKLLLSVVVLLFLVIVFLNLSSYFLFREDKIAYVYETQAKESVLAGKEFINLSERALDTLRQTLARIEPHAPFNDKQKNSLTAILENQSILSGVRIFWVNSEKKQTTEFGSAFSKKVLKKIDVKETDFKIQDQWLATSKKDFEKSSVQFFNLSAVGSVPIVGIAFADTNTIAAGKNMLVAVGFLPLTDFLKEVKLSNVTIASQNGWILYDSNPSNLFGGTEISDNPLFQAAWVSKLDRGAKEYNLAENATLGSYFKPGFNLVALSQVRLDDAMKATYTLSVKFVLLGVMAIGSAIVFAIFFAKTLTAPLNRLYAATREVASGKFDLKLKSATRDEIGALSNSFNVMSNKISDLIQESMEKVRLEGELAIASTVQQTLIPPHKIRDNRILIHSLYEPASECGGDWWGYFSHGQKAALFIADATGHGIPSALITASARSCFSVLHKLALEDSNFSLTPRNLLSFANRAIYDAASGKIMMTFFAAVIDFNQMTLTYSSAGHNPPWLFKKTDTGYKLTSLTARGSRLGEYETLPPLEELTVPIALDDVLFMYTDGVTEGKNKLGAQYGKKQMRKMLESNIGGGPELMINNLVKDFKRHNQEKPLDDDITLAAAMILPPQEETHG